MLPDEYKMEDNVSAVGHEHLADLSTGYIEAVRMMKVDLEATKERLRKIEDRLSDKCISKHEVFKLQITIP